MSGHFSGDPGPSTGTGELSATQHDLREVSRRRFLGYLAAAGVSAEVLAACSDNAGPVAGSDPAPTQAAPGTTPTTGAPPSSAASTVPEITTTTEELAPILTDVPSDRVLVVIDMQGGNDGLSTVVPAGDDRYYDLRRTLSHNEDELLAVDANVALHPALGRLHERGVAVVEGVGPIDGELSHFSMEARWQQGDVDGRTAQTTGFLGRVVDLLADGSPVTGLSMAGPTPHLLDRSNSTLALGGHREIRFLARPDWEAPELFRRELATLGNTGDERIDLVADGYRRVLALADDIADAPQSDLPDSDPMLADGGDLGEQLNMAADAISANMGIRVVYAKFGNFDTHSDHRYRHDVLMKQFDAAVDGFLRRMESAGLADRVAVATISEFGRRAGESSGGGLDHGVASAAMVINGPPAGRYGIPSPLDDLDIRGNLRTTVGFDRYLGSLAQEWLGVRASAVLPNNPEVLGFA